MDAKIAILVLAALAHSSSAAGGLRRTPKVYNALITTDENLTPSRAFPVIQPTIHETGIATYPYGPFNPYRFYNPLVRIAPQLPQVHPQYAPFPQQFLPQPVDLPPPQNEIPPTGPPQPQPQPQPQQQPQPQPEFMVAGKSAANNENGPLPLNEFGLPPSLIPLNPYQPQPAQYLPPYPYPNYPLANEGYNPYQEQYLPPYGYFPGHSFGLRRPFNPNQAAPTPAPQSAEQPQTADEPQPNAPQPSLNSIKNGVENKNSQVPDVPPPPIPTGAKSKSKA